MTEIGPQSFLFLFLDMYVYLYLCLDQKDSKTKPFDATFGWQGGFQTEIYTGKETLREGLTEKVALCDRKTVQKKHKTV